MVFPDADLDLAVKECVKGAWSFNGQRCTALKVVYVHKDIREKFLEAFLSISKQSIPMRRVKKFLGMRMAI